MEELREVSSKRIAFMLLVKPPRRKIKRAVYLTGRSRATRGKIEKSYGERKGGSTKF